VAGHLAGVIDRSVSIVPPPTCNPPLNQTDLSYSKDRKSFCYPTEWHRLAEPFALG